MQWPPFFLIASRFFRAGKYVRFSCSWIFHKGKGEQPGTNKNRTKELESEAERSWHSIWTDKGMSGIERLLVSDYKETFEQKRKGNPLTKRRVSKA